MGNNKSKIYNKKKETSSLENNIDNNINLEWLTKKNILEYNENENYRLIDQYFIMKEMYKIEDEIIFDKLENTGENVLVLDSGCGNGTWCLDMAKKYPNINFYGIDKIDIFPKTIKPINCSFEKEDLFEYISKSSKNFNIITQRFMAMYLKENEWKVLLDNYCKILKSGGYIIIVESNLIVSNMGNKTKVFAEQFKYALKARNIIPYINNKLEEIIITSGFIIEKKEYYSIPLFGNTKIGKSYGENIIQSLRNMKKWFEISLDINENELEEIIKIIKKESNEYKTYNNTYYYIAYKP